MEEQPIFCIKTKMEKEDYKKFLYVASFRKNPKIIVMILFFSFLGAIFASWSGKSFTLIHILIMWVLLAATLVVGLIGKINIRYKQRINTDNTGVFGSIIKYSFFKDHVLLENEALNGLHDLHYSQFHKVFECKEFYILYYSSNLATLIRKKDIEDNKAVVEYFKKVFKENYKSI